MTANHAMTHASRVRRLVAIGIAIAGASCASRPVTLGQTQIGQGKLYQSGSVTYDRFFQDTHAVQLEVMRADEDEAAARAPLEKALDARGAALEKLYELAVARAKKGSEDGPPIVYVTVSGLEPAKESKKNEEPAESSENRKEAPKKVPKEPRTSPRKHPEKWSSRSSRSTRCLPTRRPSSRGSPKRRAAKRRSSTDSVPSWPRRRSFRRCPTSSPTASTGSFRPASSARTSTKSSEQRSSFSARRRNGRGKSRPGRVRF